MKFCKRMIGACLGVFALAAPALASGEMDAHTHHMADRDGVSHMDDTLERVANWIEETVSARAR